MSEKTILLLHNEFKIEVEIPNNYNEVNEVVRKALFLKPEEMAKLTLMYKDEEGDNNPLDEDSFEDAFKAKEWCTRPNQDDDDDNEIKEKEEKEIQKMKDNEEKMKEIFINMMNNKVKEVNEKWKKEFENLKIKFKNELEKRENLHQKNLEQIIGNMSNYFDSVIEAKVDNYNNEIKKVFATQIINNTTDFNKGNEDFKKNVNNLKDVQNSINEDIQNSFKNFADILKFSGINNNK
jgi:hypothetical protein